MSLITTLSSQHYSRWIFLAMLVLLHISVMRGMTDTWARALMIAHFGCLMLWQPFMRGEHHLTRGQLLGIFIISFFLLVGLNEWIMAIWLSALAGIVGGKAFLFRAQWSRLFYLIGLAYLIFLLLVGVIPQILSQTILTPDLVILVQYGLPFVFLVMALLPVEKVPTTSEVIDFFYSLLLFALLIVLILGSIAFMTLGQQDYLRALIYTLLTIASMLLLLSWGWNPRAGFSGLGLFFSRYLLTLGLPFEEWLRQLAECSRRETHPEKFLVKAFAKISELPWVVGGKWSTKLYGGTFGETTGKPFEFQNATLRMVLYTRHRLTPALIWHFDLLNQLIGEFYLAKEHEQKLQQNSYVQAIHETGARLTHDVKNLLQSLNTLCSLAQTEERSAAELQTLMRRQLPVIAQRLQQTLDKLQSPQNSSSKSIAALTWWDNLKRIYEKENIHFSFEEIDAIQLPQELFDNVADNLLQNALNKRKLNPDLTIHVSLINRKVLIFKVTDNGLAFPAETANRLFHAPVKSETGLGIGLYQAWHLAQTYGYRLELTKNNDGEVCISLIKSNFNFNQANKANS